MRNETRAAFAEIRQFHAVQKFYYNDPFQSVRGLFYFDIELSVTPTSLDLELTVANKQLPRAFLESPLERGAQQD